MEDFILRVTYNEAVKLFQDKIYLGWRYQEIDFSSDDEIKKVNNHVFEASIIVIAILGFVIEQNIQLHPRYSEKYSKFIGLKLYELSKETDHSEVFYTEELHLYGRIFARIKLYKSEVKALIENKIIKYPFGILYRFILNPGDYSINSDDINFTEDELKIVLDNDNNSYDKMDIVIAIKDVYKYIVSKIV